MRKTGVEFVLAKESDAPLVAQLRQKVWSTTYRGIFPDEMIDAFDYGWHTERDLYRIRCRDYAVWLMVKEETAIGYLILKKGTPVLLNSLYVLLEYQRQGIGKQAFEVTKQYCLTHGAVEFTCYCQPDNKNAMAFYKKMGGAVVGYDMGNEEDWKNSVIWRFAAKSES